MDITSILNDFVTLVSPWRLAVMGLALLLSVALGVTGALKSKQFKWVQIVKFVEPDLNFFWMIVVYVAIAAGAAIIEPTWGPLVTTVASAFYVAMGLKLKEQISFLWPNLPIANWKLPLETKAAAPTATSPPN